MRTAYPLSSEARQALSRRSLLGAAALGLLHSHIELFGIELQEQKGRTLSLLLFAGLGERVRRLLDPSSAHQ